MLKNISTETLPLSWNMQKIECGPQETFSAMAFGASDKKEIFAIEDRLLSKFKGRLVRVEITETVSGEPEAVSTNSKSRRHRPSRRKRADPKSLKHNANFRNQR
jgi:hypothetical protein